MAAAGPPSARAGEPQRGHRQWAGLARAPFISTVFGACLLATLASCDRGTESGESPSRLVLYVSADDYLAREIVRVFQEESGIRVEMVGDSEATKTTGLVNRIRNERDNPQADVFWSSEAFAMIQLAEEGLLDPFIADLSPPHLTGDDFLWHGFASRARVIVYSPERLAPDEVPQTWMELSNPKWRGRIVMADPRFGTTRGHMGAMRAYWGAEEFQTFLNGLAANGVQMLTSGNAGVVQTVASGEADLGMTDTDDVWAAQREGLHVELVYPAHGQPSVEGEGTLLIPNTVGLVKKGRSDAAAEQFVAFLLSDRVARMMAESDSHNIPAQESIAVEYPQYAVRNPLHIDLSEAAAEMDEAVRMAMEIIGRGQ